MAALTGVVLLVGVFVPLGVNLFGVVLLTLAVVVLVAFTLGPFCTPTFGCVLHGWTLFGTVTERDAFDIGLLYVFFLPLTPLSSVSCCEFPAPSPGLVILGPRRGLTSSGICSVTSENSELASSDGDR